jgi:hypothetical protein
MLEQFLEIDHEYNFQITYSLFIVIFSVIRRCLRSELQTLIK